MYCTVVYTYLYKKPMGKKCHHHKLPMKPCVIGIGKEMIEIEKSTKEKLHNVRTFHIHFPAYLLQGACMFCVPDVY